MGLLRAGSLRRNLFGPSDVSDDVIWDALHLVGAVACVSRCGGLDTVIKEGGGDFSAGERQLLALARALLPEPPRLLIADECSSNVDEVSDSNVHDVLLSLGGRLVRRRGNCCSWLYRCSGWRRFPTPLVCFGTLAERERVAGHRSCCVSEQRALVLSHHCVCVADMRSILAQHSTCCRGHEMADNKKNMTRR